MALIMAGNLTVLCSKEFYPMDLEPGFTIFAKGLVKHGIPGKPGYSKNQTLRQLTYIFRRSTIDLVRSSLPSMYSQRHCFQRTLW